MPELKTYDMVDALTMADESNRGVALAVSVPAREWVAVKVLGRIQVRHTAKPGEQGEWLVEGPPTLRWIPI